MSDKIYLVKCYHHDYYSINEHVLRAFYNKAEAEKVARELNSETNNPLQDDGYGTYAGEEFIVEEISVEGLKCV